MKSNFQAFRDKKQVLSVSNTKLQDRIIVSNEHADNAIRRDDLRDELARQEELVQFYEDAIETRREAEKKDLEELLNIIMSSHTAEQHFLVIYKELLAKDERIPTFEWEVPVIALSKRVHKRHRLSLRPTYMTVAANFNHTRRVAIQKYSSGIYYTSVSSAKKRLEVLDTAIALSEPDLDDLKNLIAELEIQVCEVKDRRNHLKALLERDTILTEDERWPINNYRSNALKYFNAFHVMDITNTSANKTNRRKRMSAKSMHTEAPRTQHEHISEQSFFPCTTASVFDSDSNPCGTLEDSIYSYSGADCVSDHTPETERAFSNAGNDSFQKPSSYEASYSIKSPTCLGGYSMGDNCAFSEYDPLDIPKTRC